MSGRPSPLGTEGPAVPVEAAAWGHCGSWGDADDTKLALGLRDPLHHREAANEIFRRHAPLVYRILKRSLGVGADVQDVVQEVFLRFFSRAKDIEKPESMKHFLISVTIHVLKWELKRRQLRKLVGFAPDPQAVDPLSQMEPDLDGRAALKRLERVLNDVLSGQERMIFTLRFLERLTLPEVAGALGVSLATAKRRIERTRTAVTAALMDDPVLAAFAERAQWTQGGER